jgi:hypothetical protein
MRHPDQTPAAIRRLAKELQHADPVRMQLPALEAYTVLAIVQFAWRNPGLDPEQKALIERFGRDLQAAIARRAPFAGETLELGWDTSYDSPPPPAEKG